MNTEAYLITLALVATALYFGIRWLVGAYSRYRGTKIVSNSDLIARMGKSVFF